MSYQTYIHTRNDSGAVFYVGKGGEKRANCMTRRSVHWKNLVAKHGRTVVMCGGFQTEAEAFEHEKFLIWMYRDMGVPLVNMTAGGEGTMGLPRSAEHQAKINATVAARTPERKAEIAAALRASITPGRLKAMRAGMTPEHRAKMVAKHKSRTPEQVAELYASRRGRKNSPEHLAKISAASKGKVRSAETRAKMSAAKKAAMTPEMIEAIRARMTPEHIAKMRAAKLAKLAKRSNQEA